MTSRTTNRFSPEVRDRAVRMVREHGAQHPSRRAIILPIAPTTYRAQAARRRDPARLPAQAQRDAALMPEIARVFEENSASAACAWSGGS